MSDDSTPDGCLSCNRATLEAWLQSKGVASDQFELVTDLDFENAIPPCPTCKAIWRLKKVSHSITEEWMWMVRDKADGTKEIFGVVYPNGDQKLATEMPPQQWNAYLRKGQLKANRDGKLSIVRENN